MKMRYIHLLFFLGVILVGCGKEKAERNTERMIANRNIDGLKAKQAELQIEYNKLGKQIAYLQDYIDEFDGRKKLPLVTVYRVKEMSFKHYISIQGSVDTRQNTVLFSEYSGVLQQLYVKEGQNVQKGQLIARVDDGGLSQQLAQAELEYDLAKTTFERQQRLWDKKIGSEIQYLQAKTTKEASEKRIAQIEAQLAKTTILAPFAGTIDDVLVKKGAVIFPGQTPIVRIVNLSQMYVRGEISEAYLSNVGIGTKVDLYFPAIEKRMESKIRQVGNFINPNNRTFYIEVGITNEDKQIKPNLMAVMKISDYHKEKALVIEETMVREDAEGNPYVFLIESKAGKTILKKQKIEKGLVEETFVEVLRGLEEGQLVVRERTQDIYEGAEVELIQKSSGK